MIYFILFTSLQKKRQRGGGQRENRRSRGRGAADRPVRRGDVVEPLGVEFHMGLPESEHARVAPIRNSSSSIDPERFALMMSLIGPETMGGRALSLDGCFSFSGENTFNRGDVWSSEIPGAAGITNARSLAMIYAATVGEVDGVRLLDDATRELATTPVTSGPDKSLVMETKFGMGFMLPDGVVPFAGPRSFGHPGAGGSLGLCYCPGKVK